MSKKLLGASVVWFVFAVVAASASAASGAGRKLKPLLEGASHQFSADTVLGEAGGQFLIDKETRISITGGHSLQILAEKLVFKAPLIIEGQGAPGADGAAALDRKDPWVSGGGDPHRDWLEAGSEVDVGAPGEAGKPGGPGASVTIIVSASQDLQEIDRWIIRRLDGGPGGKGGPGGSGRPLQCGTHPNEMKYGAPGPGGPTGPTGQTGRFKITTEVSRAVTASATKEVVDAPPIAYGVIASGGISMGTYEAGYNWALLRYIKARNSQVQGVQHLAHPLNLVAVTGASAGSINTVLSAATWCQTKERDAQEGPKNNIFFNTWVPVGFDQLLPSGGYKPEDALLSRAAFTQVQGALIKILHDAPRFRLKCRLPIGLTVTKRAPDRLTGKSLVAPVDRFSVALEAQSNGAGLELHDIRYEDEVPYARPYLHVVDAPSRLSDERIQELLRASSAFPVAFGLQKIDYYEDAQTVQAGQQRPSRLAAKPDYFWDGGLYDNLPVGLALSLVEKPPYGGKIAENQVRLMALDPGRRRTRSSLPSAQITKAAARQPPRGLRRLSEIASNFYSVARNYELQTFIRFALPRILQCSKDAAQMCVDDPLVSSRRFPIYGERLGAFGAFVLRVFREFDFAAGIYDGLYTFVEEGCPPAMFSSSDTALPRGQCMLRAFYDLYGSLKVDQDPNSAYLIRNFLRDELTDDYGDVAKTMLATTALAPGMTAAQWIDKAPTPTKYFAVLYEDTKAVHKLTDPESTADELERIDDVVSRLAEEDVRGDLQESDQTFVDRADDWLPNTLTRVIRRSQTVEAEDHYRLGQQASNLASFTYGTINLMTRKGFDPDPSTVPNDYWSLRNAPFHFIPTQVGFSSRVIEVGWRPTYGLWRYLAVGAPVALSTRFGDKDPYDWGAHLGLSVIGRSNFIPIPAIEVGPRYTWGWADKWDPAYRGWGGQAAIYFLGGKVRVAATLDGFESGWGSRFALMFGFADFNGMAFHTFDFWGVI